MKKRVLTWVKPTSDVIHLGNYFGAIKQILNWQKEWLDIILFVADMHATTTLHDWETLRKNIIGLVRSYLASWINPERVLVFKQSDVAGHVQLWWVLASITTLGYMKRMHAYKDALQKWKSDEITMGTFNYPILMAADILLYDPDYVPVGKDQKQHLEFTRDIAEKFNSIYGETFKLPQPWIDKNVATIPWIDGRKMSKSYNNFISLLEDDDSLFKKIRRIPTSPIPIDEPKNPDECNVFNMLKHFLSDEEEKEIRNRYEKGGLADKEVKDLLYEKIKEFLAPIKRAYQNIPDEEIKKLLAQGAQKANEISSKKIEDVYFKVGYLISKS